MRVLLLIIVMLFGNVANADDTSSVAEVYGKLPEKSMFVISPSGKLIAFRDTKGDQDIVYVMDFVELKIVNAINVESVKPNNMYFVDETKLVLVVTDTKRIMGYRGVHEMSVAFTYNLETKKLHQMLTAGNGIYEAQTELGNIVGISTDRQYAYMTAWGEGLKFNLYRVKLDKKSRPRLHKRGTSDTIDFFVGDNDEVIARERYNNKSNLHSVQALVGSKWKTIFEDTVPYRTKGFVGVTPDKKSLFVVQTDQTSGRFAYYTMSLENGEISAPLFRYDDKGVENPLTDIERVVHGVQFSGFKPTYEFFDEKLNRRMRGLTKVLPEFATSITDYTPDWESMILFVQGESNAGSYLVYNKSALEMLAEARPDLTGDIVNKVVTYEYKARDGRVIPTLLTLPNGKKLENLPAIMMPHGGPESYDKIGFDYMAQYFATQGFLVIQPQFRGSDGFGIDHLLAGRGEWGRKMQDDLTDAITVLGEEGKIDAKKVCIVGASYGGYAALAGAAFTPDVYQCAVSLNGVSDIEKMLSSTRSQYGSNHWVLSYWDEVIAKGELSDDHLEQISPINSVKQINVPVLVIHGEHDKVVPIKQSKMMYDEMKDEDKLVKFVELEDGDHYLSMAKNRVRAMQEIAAFVNQHL